LHIVFQTITILPDRKEEKPGLMQQKKGILALMGSGELTATMVEVHKKLLSQVPAPAAAVFLDTPAGFQLNVEELSQKAGEYFQTRILHPLSTVSFKSKEKTPPFEAEKAFEDLRQADFILIGPGSPTYAVNQWLETPVPKIFGECLNRGGCLVAASAAALTIGQNTLPVYEIYKVGIAPYWEKGLDVTNLFDLNLVVIPHWNNAEGGTHDTRFCYMGEPRFRELEDMLPGETGILGLDEHTACLLDLEQDEAEVKGIGRVTFRLKGKEVLFEKGDRFPLNVLRGKTDQSHRRVFKILPDKDPGIKKTGGDLTSFWDEIHTLQAAFKNGLENKEAGKAVNALLELDGLIWRAQRDSESPEFISQAREILREFMVYLGLKLDREPEGKGKKAFPFIDILVQMREDLRRRKEWGEADALRKLLEEKGVMIEDAPDGPRWELK
jgi:hypothetical protein